MQTKFDRSFFDEPNFDCSFWEKSTQKINNDKIEHQYILFQKSRKTGFWVSRNYIIFDSKLVKLRVNYTVYYKYIFYFIYSQFMIYLFQTQNQFIKLEIDLYDNLINVNKNKIKIQNWNQLQLYYFICQPNKNTIHQINLNKTRVEKIKYQNDQEKESCNKKKYGFRIIRNQRCREFYSRSKELNQKIWEELKKQSLQITFKQDYVIEKMIGKGNFAKVHLCNKKSDKQQFAVKAFEKSKMINTETDRLALLKEISILRKLNYKGLIKMHEVYEDETHIYLIQEYLQGGELYSSNIYQYHSYQHIKKNQKQPENTVARIIATLLESLQYLHKKSILHRDLKPENLILRKKGVTDDIVIADFGLADFYDPLGNYIFQRCGTPGFVAPEVLQDKIYDSKVDIFSVGCLMYLLLAGKSPFKGSTYDEVVMRNYHCKVDYQYIESLISIQYSLLNKNIINYTQYKIMLGLQLIKLLLHHRPSQRPTPKEALKHEWFMLNLDEQRYKELNNNDEQIQYTKETTKSSQTDVGSCGFMKNFVGPSTCEKSEFSTPQISQVNNKKDASLYTPQYTMMQSIQEQFKDIDGFQYFLHIFQIQLCTKQKLNNRFQLKIQKMNQVI